MSAPTPMIVHVGYPKTATTTFQHHVFPHHPEIDYLGKIIPSFRYVHRDLYRMLDGLLHRSALNYRGSNELREVVDDARDRSTRKCVLLSSESFIHPSVIDIKVVAERLHETLSPCKILITIREQISEILSFYWMHGRYGQYLAIGGKDADLRIDYPISFADWLKFQKSSKDKNLISMVHYGDVVACYRDLFGVENVCVLMYEHLKTDPVSYAHDLSAFLGIDPRTTASLLKFKHEYPSSERETPWSRESDLTLLGNERDSADDLGKLIEKLRRSYQSSNARLCELTSLPLEKFGYAL